MALATTACGEEAQPSSRAGIIERVAGTGELGFNGDGRTAFATMFYLPSSVRPGPDGLVYVMDFNNHRLRRIEADGTVRTIAGSGLHSLATLGVPALDSPLENPIDFAFTADGTLLLVPLHDPRVLAIGADGVLRSIAGTSEQGDDGDGGPADAARFTELTGIAVGPGGEVYVADGGARRVRVVRPDGIVHAFAGRGLLGGGSGGEGGDLGDGGLAVECRLGRPEGLAVAPDGSVLFADSKAHAIRRVRPDGVIETVAGTGEKGFSGDGGPAREAMLSAPEGVALGPDGVVVYAADSGNQRIRRIDEQGRIETIAGSGDWGLSGDGGPALLATLNGPSRLFVTDDAVTFADMRNGCIRRVGLP